MGFVILILFIGGERVSANCEKSLCFKSLDDCHRFEVRLNQPQIGITARCEIIT